MMVLSIYMFVTTLQFICLFRLYVNPHYYYYYYYYYYHYYHFYATIMLLLCYYYYYHYSDFIRLS
jgi:hypothetical protein